MQRQFTSGSRQAPDPFDQFLEEHQFYRKHTARDASCLFRVLSEQMYDTQLHHLVIREKCVDYMRKHRKFFEANVKDRDFDEYLDDLSKPKTYGTLLELQAAGYLFQRNVLLFEPFNLGNYFNEYRAYFPEVFRVFYTPERHFDSVFTAEYIEEAAICQSIVYEILYKDFFKLPDVLFAVEQMLHGPSIENVDYRTETNQDGYGTRIHMSDGRIFDMDLPFNTNCILENHKLCHFHFVNFPKFFEDLKAHNANDVDKNAMVIQQSFLPNKYVSCVRQLLQEGITPFPYKVAKALDPNMYRNIEFDSWNELRKEAKLQNWYNGDNNFKVGAKCHVKLKSEQDLYTCHIQEIAMDKGQCVVFIEQLGEKRLVSYENLTPLPPDQFKPWTIPYRFQRQMHKYSSIRFTRHFNNRVKFNGGSNHHHYPFCSAAIESETCGSNFCINDDDPKRKLHHHHHEHYSTNTASFYKLKQYTQLENFHHTRTVEYCTMPLTVEHQHNVKSDIAGQAKESSNNTQEQTLTNLNSNDNSNAPSRSPSTGVLVESIATTIKTEPNTDPVNDIEQDHINVMTANNAPHMLEQYEFDPHNMGATLYMPDSQGFYTMYPPYAAAMPDDYYGGYCIDAGAYHPGSTAFMPTLNGANGAPLYYVCNGPPPPVTANGNFTPGNAFMNMPPPAPQNFGLQTAPPHMLNPNGAASYYSQYPPSTPTIINNSCQQISETTTTTAVSVTSASAASSGRQTPSTRYPRSGHSSTQITPLSCRRINFDAKKSSKTNGVDLPTDIVTLRHFYNLGLEYYHKHLKRNDNEQSAVNSDSNNNSTHNANNNEQHCDDLSNDVQNIRLDENANQIEKSKPDGNNNNIPSSLTNSADGFQSSDARPNSTNNAQNVNNCNSKNSKPTNEKNAHYSSGQGNSGGCGNAAPSHRGNNFRRYNARYFNKTDRSGQQQQNHHANQRYNSSTQQQQQHHQQQQLQQTQGSQNCKTLSSNNSNNKSQDSNTTNNSTPITSRVYQSQQSRQQHQQQQHQPQQQHQQQQQQHQHQQHQQQQQQQQHQQQHQSQSLQVEQFVQTSPMYGFEHLPADPMNANNVQTQTSSASNNSSHFNNHPLYIPMNMAGPPPPPPYFSTHPPPSMPPPCGPPPNALENLEFSPMEIPPPQAGNHPGMHSPYGAPTSGHISFPPPPTSIPMFYCSPNGVPLTPGPAELMNQPHLPPQGYLCLPPPPHQLAPPHQMQQAALNNNRTPLPNSNVLPAQSPVSNKPQGTSGITTDQRV